jgi:hypothetical protein
MKRLDMNEVLSLARPWKSNFLFLVPQVVLNLELILTQMIQEKRRFATLRRFSIIKSYYGTGGDLNVDEIHEVIPMTEECGVWHPQEVFLTDTSNLQRLIK